MGRNRIAFALPALLALTVCAHAAPVVDASASEARFGAGDYAGARTGFDAALEQFLRVAPKDDPPHEIFSEGEYLLDRLCDCAFTQRDWARLKLYSDNQWKLANQDIGASKSRLAGAIDSNVAVATARFLADQLDEGMRLKSIFQLKRTLALLLLDSAGKGERGSQAIGLYQQLTLLMRKVMSVEGGAYKLDVSALDKNLPEFEKLYRQLPESEMKTLWDKYRPAQPAVGAPK